MTEDNARQNAAQEMERAKEVLAEARHLFAGGFYNGVVTRAYYAAFHGARALLFTRGLESKTHRSVIQLFNLHFIKDGPLSTQVAEYLSRLETYRELSDYTAIAQFTEAQAREELARAEAFLDACRSLFTP
ncbi:MAG: HEPN domain-containing protein [Lentisphaerae bacterium]|nr:HEPN domain-containing protein [Lentisphaerota bacterium]